MTEEQPPTTKGSNCSGTSPDIEPGAIGMCTLNETGSGLSVAKIAIIAAAGVSALLIVLLFTVTITAIVIKVLNRNTAKADGIHSRDSSIDDRVYETISNINIRINECYAAAVPYNEDPDTNHYIT